MSHAFGAFAAPDSHIAFLHQHPGSVHDYLEGVPPKQATMPVPADWPSEPLESLGSWGVNHRNTELYHWILNGGPELAVGAGAFFQMWHAPDHDSLVLKLDKYNERFAFQSDQVPGLAALVKTVDAERVHRSFCDWLTSRGEDSSSIDQYACEPFVDEFRNFLEGLEDAMRRGQGLIW
jgi:hypothetical protein